eukprot:31260-Pelagococcus_subviridis.AAC.12
MYGFGPRQSSHTTGKSVRSHPSASGSWRRRAAWRRDDDRGRRGRGAGRSANGSFWGGIVWTARDLRRRAIAARGTASRRAGRRHERRGGGRGGRTHHVRGSRSRAARPGVCRDRAPAPP